MLMLLGLPMHISENRLAMGSLGTDTVITVARLETPGATEVGHEVPLGDHIQLRTSHLDSALS